MKEQWEETTQPVGGTCPRAATSLGLRCLAGTVSGIARPAPAVQTAGISFAVVPVRGIPLL